MSRTTPLGRDAAEYVGVILAAGKGQRLLPLTAYVPKPLLPFAGVELLAYAQRRLYAVGIRDCIVNTHHLGTQVQEHCTRHPLGLTIHIAEERRALLGTGGALGAMVRRRQGRGLVVLNGDVISDFPLMPFIENHRASGAVASLALLPKPHPRETKIWCSNGSVVAIGGERPPVAGASPHGFACMQVLDEEFLQLLPEGQHYSIIDYYTQALSRGMPIAGFVHDAFWYDIGTPSAYLRAHRSLLRWWDRRPFTPSNDPLGILALQGELDRPMSFVHTGEDGPALIADDFAAYAPGSIGPYVVINHGVHMGRGAVLADCVLLAKSCIAEQQQISRAIIAHNCQVYC